MVPKWAWVLWILSGVVLEFIALFSRGKGDTLSENVWAVFQHPTWGKFAAWMLTAFLLWLTVHFATRGKWG